MEPLHRLVYHSLNRIKGSADDVDRALRDILSAARRNNPRLGVTGALMFNASCFIQVLEGPRVALDQLFQPIRRDQRHENVSLLTFEPTAERRFDQWSMAFVGARDSGGRLTAIALESGYDPSRMSGEATAGFLRGLMLSQERALAR
jgi:hypothetical protein